jgi:hypothetical protein
VGVLRHPESLTWVPLPTRSGCSFQVEPRLGEAAVESEGRCSLASRWLLTLQYTQACMHMQRERERERERESRYVAQVGHKLLDSRILLPQPPE